MDSRANQTHTANALVAGFNSTFSQDTLRVLAYSQLRIAEIRNALESPENNLKFFEVAFWFPADVSAFGGPFALFPAFFAWIGAFSEAVGGVFWIVGFQTRINSFLIGCTMLVAAFGQQFNSGIWFMLPALGIFWVSLYGLVLGSGRFGVDFLVTKSFT